MEESRATAGFQFTRWRRFTGHWCGEGRGSLWTHSSNERAPAECPGCARRCFGFWGRVNRRGQAPALMGFTANKTVIQHIQTHAEA